MKKSIFVIIAVVLLLTAAAGDWLLFEKAKPVNFSEWTSSAAAEEFSYVTLQRGYGINTVHYNLSDPEIKEFCTILNSISAEDCKLEKRYNDRKDDTIAMYRNGEYWVFQLLEEPQIYVLLDTEQAPEYGANGSGKHVIIESPELWNYVVNMLENALK